MSRILWADEEVCEAPYHPYEFAEWALDDGGVIVYPTDTVYGLLTAYDSAPGYKRIYELKGRSFNKPLALLIHGDEELSRVVSVKLSDSEQQAFRHGQITAILSPDAVPSLPNEVAELQPGPVGVRCPTGAEMSFLIQHCPWVWATSVNRSGQPPATTADEVLDWLEELQGLGIDPPELVVLSRTPTSGTPSRVVDLTGDEPKWIR